MNEILAAVERARRLERESFLGSYSLSVIPSLVRNYAPKDMDILALGSASPVRVDERGMVHFAEPVSALARERRDSGVYPGDQKKVVGVTLHPTGVNGNFFVPLITEKDSELYARFRRFMRELVQHHDWRGHPLPGRGLDVSLTESESNMWDKWIRMEIDRDPARDVYWREQAL